MGPVRDNITRNVVLIESQLEIALPMAALLEARGFNIVGLIVERDAAFAVAEGEEADFSARIANISLTDERSTTCTALLYELGLPTLRIAKPDVARRQALVATQDWALRTTKADGTTLLLSGWISINWRAPMSRKIDVPPARSQPIPLEE